LALVHNELRPVFDLPPDLRCCFVLRTLTGYSREQVGLLMNIHSEVVEMLTQSALVRFAALARKREENGAAFMPAPGFLQDANPIEGAT
jgi:DNA-directed RNA polymerase specialized sigma24 family protein